LFLFGGRGTGWDSGQLATRERISVWLGLPPHEVLFISPSPLKQKKENCGSLPNGQRTSSIFRITADGFTLFFNFVIIFIEIKE